MALTPLQKLAQTIRENVKGTHVSILAESDIAEVSEFVKTPSLDLNRVLSGNLFKGIPNRTLVGIAGPEHTFKSSFAVLCAADAVRQGYKVVIIDTERGITQEFCERWGLDISNCIYIYEMWIERIIPILAQLKESGEKKFVVIIDSIGGLDRYKTYKDALDDNPKSDQGQLAKSIRTLIKLLNNLCVESESIGIITLHQYSRPGTVPLPDAIGGGKAVRLLPSIVLELRKENIKDGKEVIGNEITVLARKNRLYPSMQTATIEIDYLKGINPYAGLVPLLEKAELIYKEKNTYLIKDTEEKLGVGYDNATDALKDKPELLESLNKWLENTKYSSISKELLEIEDELEDSIVEETNGKRSNGKTSKKKKKNGKK